MMPMKNIMVVKTKFLLCIYYIGDEHGASKLYYLNDADEENDRLKECVFCVYHL